MLEIGSIIDGKYKILNEIGRGGMSIVYLAMNERANKSWAIKEVRKDGVENYEVIRQSQMVETEMLKRFNHPNLPSIVDVIDQQDSFLIVMDYIEGKPLNETLDQYGALPSEDVVEWAKQLCDVLQYLHSRKPPIIYRDMKPANVMLQPDGTVMLIDFGTAREFKHNRVADTTCLGTQGYAAPEQFGGQGQTDPRTDVYCLGATIYHLLTGHNPSDPPYEMYPIRQWNPTLSSGLEKIVQKCTQRNPKDRYQSCAELLYALEHYEEEDDGYKKRENRKWATFIATIVMAFVMMFSSIFCKYKMTQQTDISYVQCLNNMALVMDQDEKIKYCEEAIKLDPRREEAYTEIVDIMEMDGNFSEEESKTIRSIMPQYIVELQKNPEAYMRVGYRLGVMYFYYYTESDDTQNAAKWLNVALGTEIKGMTDERMNEILTPSKAVRAKVLSQILKYYQNLKVTNLAGDTKASYGQYWDDLSEVVTPDIAKEDNNVTALVMYNFMVNQIAVRAQDFADAGVSVDEMHKMLDMIEKAKTHDASDSYQKELYEKLTQSIDHARKAVDIVKVAE